MKRISIILGGGPSILVRYGGSYNKHSIFYPNGIENSIFRRGPLYSISSRNLQSTSFISNHSHIQSNRFFKKILFPGRFFAFFELFYSLSASIGQKDTSLY